MIYLKLIGTSKIPEIMLMAGFNPGLFVNDYKLTDTVNYIITVFTPIKIIEGKGKRKRRERRRFFYYKL
jgi:hypothetical protein